MTALEMILAVLVVVCLMAAIRQHWNYYRVRHLLRSGDWSVRHATYGGTTSEWHYSHRHSQYSFLRKWTLAEAYERQLQLDRLRRLDLPDNEGL